MIEMDRKTAETRLLEALSYVFPKDKVEQAKRILENMPENDFCQLIAECIASVKDKEISNKEWLNLMKKAATMFGNDPAVSDEEMEWMTSEESSDLLNDINHSHPSDLVKLSWREDDKMCSFWKRTKDDSHFVPSDLFFSGHIPLLDCEIEVDERDKPDAEGVIAKYRVTVVKDYKTRISSAPQDMAVTVGAISIYAFPGASLIIPLVVMPGVDAMLTWHKIGSYINGHGTKLKTNFIKRQIANASFAYLSTWYGIQIALLHPTIKNIFSTPTKELVYDSADTKTAKRKRRITRYVKAHVITTQKIENAITEYSTKHNRKTPAWYVIGHWRTYKKTGKKIFVDGHWKGPHRDEMRNLDEMRERIIDPINHTQED